MQNAHEGLKVASAPNTATAKNRTEVKTVLEWMIMNIPKAANKKPAIAGIRLETFNEYFLYKKSTDNPETQLPKAPANSGTEV